MSASRAIKHTVAGGLALALGVALLAAFAPVQYQVFRHNVPGIDVHRLFDTRHIPASPTPRPMPIAGPARQRDVAGRLPEGVEQTLGTNQTVAFLVIQDGRLVYERYWHGYRQDSPVTVFSVSKSILALLVGMAIGDGLIRSADQPVSDFIAGFRRPGLADMRLSHLLQMTSGLPYVERTINNPFGLHAHLTYTDDIAGLLADLAPGHRPGEVFAYKSVDYALLGLVLRQALGSETLTHYLSRKLWTPMGAAHPAAWAIDSATGGMEKAWCCLAMTARDLARLGLLIQDGGTVGATPVVPPAWMAALERPAPASERPGNYHLGWWLMAGSPPALRAEGIHGQFLFVDPGRRTVIVRLGKGLGDLDWGDWVQLLKNVADLSAPSPRR